LHFLWWEIAVGFLARESASLFDETINQPLGSSFPKRILSQVASLSVPSTTPNAIDFISIETRASTMTARARRRPADSSPMTIWLPLPTRLHSRPHPGKIPSGSTLTPVDVWTRAQTRAALDVITSASARNWRRPRHIAIDSSADIRA